jgi:lysyl-tRNA synthetase class 2
MSDQTPENPSQDQSPEQSLQTPEQIAVRREKLNQLREAGEAYPNLWRPDTTSGAIASAYENAEAEALEEAAVKVRIGGRMMGHRVMGKSSFIHVQDGEGRIQLFLNRDALGEDIYNPTKKWDLGDIIGAEGTLFRTKTG